MYIRDDANIIMSVLRQCKKHHAIFPGVNSALYTVDLRSPSFSAPLHVIFC